MRMKMSMGLSTMVPDGVCGSPILYLEGVFNRVWIVI
jgi:hypothetical protein